MMGVGRLSGDYGEAVWRVWGGCLEGMGRLSGGCGEVVCKVWKSCLEYVWRISGGYMTLSDGCGQGV